MKWYQNLNVVNFGISDREHTDWVDQCMTEMTLQSLCDDLPPPQNFRRAGTHKKSVEELKAYFTELGGRMIRHRTYGGNPKSGAMTFVWDHGVVVVDRTGRGTGEIEGATRDPEFMTEMRKFAVRHMTQKERTAAAHTIISTNRGLQLEDVGLAAKELEPGNYMPEIIEDYKTIVADLDSDDPKGRIALIDGPPGTGKTYLVRALMNDVKNGIFVFVPPGMTEQIQGPSIMPLLLSTRERQLYHWSDDDDDDDTNDERKRLILVLEDADTALVSRGPDNMGLVSALLNLSDGVIGHMLDLRIVATTNARRADIDKAILRPGRLTCYSRVGALSSEQADKVLQRLKPGAKLSHVDTSNDTTRSVGFGSPQAKDQDQYTLAEVYALAGQS